MSWLWKKKPNYEIKSAPPARPDAEAALRFQPPPVQKRHIAFLVFHGMGQQVPYETLSMLAESILDKRPGSDNDKSRPEVSVGLVKIDTGDTSNDPPLARVQFLYTPASKDGTSSESIETHIYEAYWAPLTAGKISFFETLSIFYGAAWDGVWACWRNGPFFERWMFGDFQRLPVARGTAGFLLSAVACFTAALLPVLLFALKVQSLPIPRDWREGFATYPGFTLVGLVLLAVYSWAVRYVVVQYLGDVAIYVSSHKVSRFDKTRTKIQERASSVLRQLYKAENPQYDAIVLVGHSLGSVIAYDALNAAHVWDETSHRGKLGVAERTHRLITFGSPLDKTAFLFRTQVSGPRFLREALAAQKQPLICDYKRHRPKTFSWVNIHSWADIISGPLDYYDTPEGPHASDPKRNPVVNVPDPWAFVPFLAHVQYWRNDTLRKHLREAIESLG